MDLANKQVEPSGPDPPQMLKFNAAKSTLLYPERGFREKLKI